MIAVILSNDLWLAINKRNAQLWISLKSQHHLTGLNKLRLFAVVALCFSIFFVVLYLILLCVCARVHTRFVYFSREDCTQCVAIDLIDFTLRQIPSTASEPHINCFNRWQANIISNMFSVHTHKSQLFVFFRLLVSFVRSAQWCFIWFACYKWMTDLWCSTVLLLCSLLNSDLFPLRSVSLSLILSLFPLTVANYKFDFYNLYTGFFRCRQWWWQRNDWPWRQCTDTLSITARANRCHCLQCETMNNAATRCNFWKCWILKMVMQNHCTLHFVVGGAVNFKWIRNKHLVSLPIPTQNSARERKYAYVQASAYLWCNYVVYRRCWFRRMLVTHRSECTLNCPTLIVLLWKMCFSLPEK